MQHPSEIYNALLKLITLESVFVKFFKTGYPLKFISGQVFEARYGQRFMFTKCKFRGSAGSESFCPRKFFPIK